MSKYYNEYITEKGIRLLLGQTSFDHYDKNVSLADYDNRPKHLRFCFDADNEYIYVSNNKKILKIFHPFFGNKRVVVYSCEGCINFHIVSYKNYKENKEIYWSSRGPNLPYETLLDCSGCGTVRCIWLLIICVQLDQDAIKSLFGRETKYIRCDELEKMIKIEKINWNSISKNPNLTIEFIEKHHDKLNWNSISKNPNLTIEFIEKYCDKLDWNELLKNSKNIIKMIK